MAEQFVQIPVVVEAARWDGSNLGELQAFTTEECRGGLNVLFWPVPAEDRGDGSDVTGELWDGTLHRWVHLVNGDWVVKTPLGLFTSYSDAKFRERFRSLVAG